MTKVKSSKPKLKEFHKWLIKIKHVEFFAINHGKISEYYQEFLQQRI